MRKSTAPSHKKRWGKALEGTTCRKIKDRKEEGPDYVTSRKSGEYIGDVSGKINMRSSEVRRASSIFWQRRKERVCRYQGGIIAKVKKGSGSNWNSGRHLKGNDKGPDRGVDAAVNGIARGRVFGFHESKTRSRATWIGKGGGNSYGLLATEKSPLVSPRVKLTEEEKKAFGGFTWLRPGREDCKRVSKRGTTVGLPLAQGPLGQHEGRREGGKKGTEF